MRRTFLLLCLATVPFVLAADPAAPPAPPDGWKEFSPKDQSFSVWLPDNGGRRNERERTIIIRRTRIRVNAIVLQTNDGPTYSASTYIFPPTMMRKIPGQQRLEILRDVYVNEVTGKVTAEKEIKLGVLQGREYMVQTGRGVSRLRVFSAGSRMYQAVVSGSKEEVESKNAKTFLDSYRLHKLLMAPMGDAGTTDKEPAKPPMGAVKAIPGDIYAFIEQAVKDKRVAEVDIMGFTLTKSTYREVPKEGAVLIGLQLSQGKFLNNTIVDGIRPIFLTKKGEKLGIWQGTNSDDPVILKAKPGYVVGGMSVRTGLGIDGLSLTYMKLEKGKIDEKARYKSHWVGGQGGNPANVGGQGIFFVGVCGHLNGDKKPCSIGFITVLSPEG